LKTFYRARTRAEILALCATLGLAVSGYRSSDSIRIYGGGCSLDVNTRTGRFEGETPDGIAFHSWSDEHEHEVWFQQLLCFFHTDDPYEEPNQKPWIGNRTHGQSTAVLDK
jgi:hypothetical protein